MLLPLKRVAIRRFARVPMSVPTANMTRISLPGFGLPVDYAPPHPNLKRILFPHALDGKDLEDGYVTVHLTSLREFTMLRWMNQLTDKPDWHKKIFDPVIAGKWKSEALSDAASNPNIDIVPEMVDWCIKELQYKAGLFEKTSALSVFTGDVVKSDLAIPPDLQNSLKLEVAKLEDVPTRLQDWHPDSQEKVLDLVHPSLFPLVYGQSRVLPQGSTTLDNFIEECGNGEVTVLVPEDPTDPNPRRVFGRGFSSRRERAQASYSRKFQWLPCEVDVSGDVPKIMTYINNLHPQKHSALYSIIEQILGRTIPLWNMTLTPLKTSSFRWKRITYDECVYDPDPENGPETDGPQQEPDEDEDVFDERRTAWIEATRQVVQPVPGEFAPPTAPRFLRTEGGDWKPEHRVDIQRDFAKTGIQVIVKLANIHLTPEKPSYDGGTWHVEGQLNEHICASALYYYDNENITSSSLAFRQQSSLWDASDVRYPQNNHDWLQEVFGCENQMSTVQFVGSIETREGRLITFPNILQHQVQPFRLEDPTKPGHRKILALFLVDPNIKIISTGNVPCQRRDWWAEQIQMEGGTDGGVSKLPVEIQDHIFSGVDDFPISMEEAKTLRLELMEERKRFAPLHTAAFEAPTFSLCEH